MVGWTDRYSDEWEASLVENKSVLITALWRSDVGHLVAFKMY